MAAIHKDLYLIVGTGTFDISDDNTSVREPCAFCGGDQMILVARSVITSSSAPKRPDTRWLRCVSCFRGHVDNMGTISPGIRPLDTPDVLTGDDLAAWDEALGCLSVGANTAAVMMCRKLLFHIAVSHGLPEKDDKGRAPNFATALEHLEKEGVITRHMRPWVTKIKDVGNEANHEIPHTSAEDAIAVAKFTRQLLMLAYELPAMVAENAPEELAAAELEP